MFKVWTAEIPDELVQAVGDEGLNDLIDRLEDTLNEWIEVEERKHPPSE